MTATVQLLTPAGPFAVPVRCHARRALPTLADVPDNGKLELGARGGGVMLAATAERRVTLTNGGALDVAYEIKVGR